MIDAKQLAEQIWGNAEQGSLANRLEVVGVLREEAATLKAIALEKTAQVLREVQKGDGESMVGGAKRLRMSRDAAYKALKKAAEE